jgi:hypothetical protein
MRPLPVGSLYRAVAGDFSTCWFEPSDKWARLPFQGAGRPQAGFADDVVAVDPVATDIPSALPMGTAQKIPCVRSIGASCGGGTGAGHRPSGTGQPPLGGECAAISRWIWMLPWVNKPPSKTSATRPTLN